MERRQRDKRMRKATECSQAKRLNPWELRDPLMIELLSRGGQDKCFLPHHKRHFLSLDFSQQKKQHKSKQA